MVSLVTVTVGLQILVFFPSLPGNPFVSLGTEDGSSYTDTLTIVASEASFSDHKSRSSTIARLPLVCMHGCLPADRLKHFFFV